MAFKPGHRPWNKVEIDIDTLLDDYRTNKHAVRDCAERHGISITALYRRLKAAGVQLRRGGDANRGTQAADNNPNWKGGRCLDAAGYVVIRQDDGTYVREHRVVASEKLGRPLTDQEVVHHRDGNRANNDPGNLEVLPSQSEHMKHHMTPDEARRRGAAGGWTRKAALAAVEES